MAGTAFTLRLMAVFFLGPAQRLALAIPRPLPGTEWVATSYRSAAAENTTSVDGGGDGDIIMIPILAGTTISANFGDDPDGGGSNSYALEGLAGCNHYLTTYSTSGPWGIDIDGAIMSEEAYCSEPEGIMEQEVAYLDLLRRSAHYQIFGDRLDLLDDDLSLLVRYVPLGMHGSTSDADGSSSGITSTPTPTATPMGTAGRSPIPTIQLDTRTPIPTSHGSIGATAPDATERPTGGSAAFLSADSSPAVRAASWVWLQVSTALVTLIFVNL